MKDNEKGENAQLENLCQGCDHRENLNRYLLKSVLPSLAENESQARTVLKQALKQAQQNDLKCKTLFEMAPDAILVADAETGIVLEANEKAAKLLGILADGIVGMHQSQLHPAQEREKYRTLFRQHAQKKSPQCIEDAHICNREGEKIPVQISTSVIEVDHRKIILGIFRDMTERKDLLRELKAGHDRLERFSEATFEGIAIHHQGTIMDVNQQYLDMFGYTLEELKKIPHSQTIAPESMDLVREKMASGYEGIYEVRAVKKDGTVFPIQVQAKECILDGQPVRIAAFRDLTEQKKLQQQLAQIERKYTELYKNAPVALYRTRISDGKLLECNRAAATLLGYADEEELVNLSSVTETYVDPEQRNQFLEALQKNKKVHDFQLQLKRRDGSPVWVSTSAEFFPETESIEGMMLDISMIKVLSKTESAVLDLIMQGKSNREIASMTDRTTRTIEDHRAHIMKKLGVHNIVELTQVAMKSFNPGQNDDDPK